MKELSNHLSQKQLTALVKLGNIMIPGDAQMPRFSATDALAQVDQVLDPIDPLDLRDLRLLLSTLYYLPSFLLIGLFGLFEIKEKLPRWARAPIRGMHVGLKGILVSLYYSQPEVQKKLGFLPRVTADDRSEK